MNKHHILSIGSQNFCFVEINLVNKHLAKLFLFFSFSGATLLSCGVVKAASLVNSKVYSNAYINILSGTADERTASGINPSVQSFAQANNAKAFASANRTSLKVKAESDGTGLSYPAGGVASFQNSYKVIGNTNNIGVPLIFNFGLTGELDAYTVPKNAGSVASVAFNYNFTNYSDSFSETKGSVQITSQGGVPVYFSQSGNLGSNKFGAIIQPTLEIGTDLKKILPKDLSYFNIADKLLKISSKDLGTNDPLKKLKERTSLLEGLIVNAIQFGIPSLSILPGIKANIGFDVSYIFDSQIQLTETIRQNGRLDGYLYGSASSSPTARGSSNFGNTLKLTSITVPQTFDALDIENLQVAFDSGDTIPVKRQINTIIPSTPVPEPSTYYGTAVAFAICWLIKRKYKSVQTKV